MKCIMYQTQTLDCVTYDNDKDDWHILSVSHGNLTPGTCRLLSHALDNACEQNSY